jgi:tetratricopeptide (TPR) repeat protein
MASIFLSYDRDDEARARPVAALLERSGHSVWWDRQIKGGGEFGAEIEAALNAADKIIVLWSQQATKSAWVRDEASVGRDTGRLVPVTIDGTPAPLGFRQFQTIDLSKWRGRAGTPEAQDLLNALGAASPPMTASRPRESPSRPGPSRRLLFGGAAFLAIAAGGALIWQFWPTSSGVTPTFAIVAGDSSPAAKQLAADVATRVAGVTDPSSADFHIVDENSGQVGKGYALKVGASSGRGNSQSLTLVDAGRNVILWSSLLDVPRGSPQDISQAVAVSAQRALSCAADGLSYRREKIDQETLKLYITGCTQYDAAYGTNSSNAPLIKLFEEVIANAPHFASAWSMLFSAESEDLATPNRETLIETAKTQLERSKQLGIDVAEAYAVRAGLLSPSDFAGIFRAFDEGVAKFPDNAFLLRLRGERSSYVGRMSDAVSDTGLAVQIDPLSPANQQSFASELAYSGDIAAGYAQLRKAERLWPNSMTVLFARYRLDLRFGDAREAQALYREYATQLAQNPAQGRFIEARINPTPENIEAAIEAERKINRQFPPFIASVVQALAHFGRKDEVIELMINYPGGRWREYAGYNAEVLFRPMMRDVWRDPRSMAAAAHLGLLHYWKVSGNWPDFCFDPTLPYDCKREAAKY